MDTTILTKHDEVDALHVSSELVKEACLVAKHSILVSSQATRTSIHKDIARLYVANPIKALLVKGLHSLAHRKNVRSQTRHSPIVLGGSEVIGAHL